MKKILILSMLLGLVSTMGASLERKVEKKMLKHTVKNEVKNHKDLISNIGKEFANDLKSKEETDALKNKYIASAEKDVNTHHENHMGWDVLLKNGAKLDFQPGYAKDGRDEKKDTTPGLEGSPAPSSDTDSSSAGYYEFHQPNGQPKVYTNGAMGAIEGGSPDENSASTSRTRHLPPFQGYTTRKTPGLNGDSKEEALKTPVEPVSPAPANETANVLSRNYPGTHGRGIYKGSDNENDAGPVTQDKDEGNDAGPARKNSAPENSALNISAETPAAEKSPAKPASEAEEQLAEPAKAV